MSPEKIAELKEKKPELELVFGECGFRRPNRTEYDMWFDSMQEDKGQSSKWARRLAKQCLLTDEEGLNNLLEKRPAVLQTKILNGLTDLVGLGDDEDPVKKV